MVALSTLSLLALSTPVSYDINVHIEIAPHQKVLRPAEGSDSQRTHIWPQGSGPGNYQPSRNVSHVRGAQTGGQVQSGAVARYDNDNINDGVGSGTDSYTMYWGNGDSFPQKSQWVSFVDMFNNYKPHMFSSCSNQFGVPDNSGPEVGAIWDAIQQVSKETLIDHRFILAVVMQESSGCVRAPTSDYGVRNPGLMQDHNGWFTCNEGGSIKTPCPDDFIAGMIREGSAGTDDGDGLAQVINQAGDQNVRAFYRAARLYNSGSIAGNCLECGIATHCYASDIANRLTGWVNAEHACYLDD
ncbi:hypothetical protein LTS18_011566 [Coniosporium uncinatum]|uniref:Uncharacterized protein n=1 Tax=Coniosporium uncinatum TaxID=93489 RepID=A0ACC3DVX2_9PEZI|nr:hypothetical protein LTS18_011566 [Coniosporium uncinatum]